MVLSRSLLRRATHADLNRLLNSTATTSATAKSLHTTQKARHSDSNNASSSAVATEVPKKRPRRSQKTLEELPQYYTLPDGTPAKPLEQWRYIPESVSVKGIIKDTSSSSSGVVVASEVQDESEQTSLSPCCGVELSGHAENEKAKRRRKPKTLEDSPADQLEPPVRHIRRSKKLESSGSDEGETPKPRTILAQEIQENLRKFPHCLLLTRVGQFYESYFEQAQEIASLLNIKLTSRKWGGSRVAMCGFPLIHLDKHLKVLVQQHKRFVAMCEEFPLKHDFGAKDFERRVTRIITPGTLIDEPFLNAYENNFLLAVSPPPDLEENQTNASAIGLAWIDVSTGEFYSKSASLESVQDELARINPCEVVLPKSFVGLKDHQLLHVLAEENCFLSYATKSSDTPIEVPPEPSHPILQHSRQIPLAIPEQGAVDLLTSYLNAHLLENMPPLTEPIQDNTGRMQIDAHTIKALEIRETNYEGGTRGSLFSVIKRTVTNGGTRLLSRWLCSPSTLLPEINARQSLVEFFVNRPHLTADITQLLSQIDDTTRLTQKFLVGRGDPSDLAAISRTILTCTQVVSTLAAERALEEKEKEGINAQDWTSLNALVSRMHPLAELSETIERALGTEVDDTADSSLNNEHEQYSVSPKSNQLLNWRVTNNRWSIQPDFSKPLKTLHRRFQSLLADKEALETRLRKAYHAPSLTLRASPAQGMHIHLARKRDQANIMKDLDFVPTYESGSTKCFFNKEWARLGNHIIDIIDRLAQAEKDAFNELRTMINEHAFSLRQNAGIVDELDVALSFAKIADELKFVKPTMTNDNIYDVVNGRHPSVEIGLLTSGRVFTPNSVQLQPDARTHVITGPNMAGKSTFLRQTALIAVLAQVGSFVPADAAKIGIVDKLFSRIGAKDDLFRDRSTFMVEMLETADILKRATARSLVIMDEVGRGTTVNDGLAIAFATVHHLTTVNQCRSLFATHFHELAPMLGLTSKAAGSGEYQNVHFYCTDVDELEDGYFAYSYRLRPGVNWDSHGLKVAQLAGLPDAAIAVASDTLSWLKRDHGSQAAHRDSPAEAKYHEVTKATLAL